MSASTSGIRKQYRIPAHVTRTLHVKNLPFKITGAELYEIFGKFGAIRQIRLGNTEQTRGTAYVVYENIVAAKAAVDKLSGFSVAGRFLVLLYYNPTRLKKGSDALERKAAELERLKQRLQTLEAEEGVGGDE